VKFRRILIGIAIHADGISAFPHEVLVPIDKTVEEKLVESLKEVNAYAFLGRHSLDALCLRVDPHTKAPIKNSYMFTMNKYFSSGFSSFLLHRSISSFLDLHDKLSEVLNYILYYEKSSFCLIINLMRS